MSKLEWIKEIKMIKQGESEVLELKESLSVKEEIGNTISAFSNTKGGMIIIGINDFGETIGLNIGKNTIEQLANYIKQNTDNSIYPKISVVRISDKDVIIVEVNEVDEKPVFFKGKAYKRVGKSNHKLSASEIRKLAKESGRKLYWDKQICEGTDLKDIDLGFVKKFFILFYEKRFNKKITGSPKELLETLNCIRSNQPTNAGILLFGKNPQKTFMNSYIALARYKGNIESVERLDYKEFKGNIFEQIDKCNEYIIEHIATMSNLDPGKVRREDIPEYGKFSIRELITNAVCHRNYENQHTKVIIKMFSNKITFYSPGGLPKNITPENISERQFSRNPAIANALAKIDYIEELGEGWNKILNEHKKHPLKPRMPKIESDKSVTLIAIYSTKKKFEKKKVGPLNGPLNGPLKTPDKRRNEILKFIRQHKKVKRAQLVYTLKIPLGTLKRDLAILISKGFIEKVGSDKTGHYILKKKKEVYKELASQKEGTGK